MTEGAFRSMQHDHYFEAISPEITDVIDVFEFAAPIPVLGKVVEKLFLRDYMLRLLRQRNEILRQIAESNRLAEFLPMP